MQTITILQMVVLYPGKLPFLFLCVYEQEAMYRKQVAMTNYAEQALCLSGYSDAVTISPAHSGLGDLH